MIMATIKEEEIEQIKALDCLWHYYPKIACYAIHIANQRKTNWFNANHLKRMGVKKGVPDLFFPKPKGQYHGLWIEVKSKTGKPSKEQIAFMDTAKSDMYWASFAYGAQDVVDIVCIYFDVPAVKVLGES
jgi:hypothetical protein